MGRRDLALTLYSASISLYNEKTPHVATAYENRECDALGVRTAVSWDRALPGPILKRSGAHVEQDGPIRIWMRNVAH